MMLITAVRLARFAPAAAHYTRGLQAAAERFAISTPRRVQYWLANCAYESSGFETLAENLYYTKPETLVKVFRRYFDRDHDGAISEVELAWAIKLCRQPARVANFVYANRMGNGDEVSGDGFKHRGMGIIQLTGKDNQRAYSRAVHGDDRVVADPMLLTRDPGAALSAGWFVERNGLNALADAGNFKGYCGKINTGSIHGIAHGLDDGDRADLDSREDWRLRAAEIFV